MTLECTFAWSITSNILPKRAVRLEEMISKEGELHA